MHDALRHAGGINRSQRSEAANVADAINRDPPLNFEQVKRGPVAHRDSSVRQKGLLGAVVALYNRG